MSRLIPPLAFIVLTVMGLAAQAELEGSWALTSKGERNTLHSVLTVERTGTILPRTTTIAS